MKRGNRMRKDALRRYFVYRLKLIEIFHLSLLCSALADEEFAPENVMGHSGRDFALSVRTAYLSWFCTIVDRSSGGLNVFEVWRQLFPKHRKEIESVWEEIEPHWEILREFRDKSGFHADTPRNYLSSRKRVLDNPQVSKAVQDFLDLAKALIKREEEELPDFVSEVESFLLDFELEFNQGINRGALKQLLVLPRGDFKKKFI